MGTLDSLWDANMDMLSPTSGLDLADESWPIYARSVNAPPAFLGGDSRVTHSAINRGSILEGTVENSILFRGVSVAKGAEVKDCILMQDVAVSRDAVVHHVIADKNVVVMESRTLMGHENYPMTIAKNSKV